MINRTLQQALKDEPIRDVALNIGIGTFVSALHEEGLDSAEPCKLADKAEEAATVPTLAVRFQGEMAALFKAFSLAQARGLPILDVRVAYYSVGRRLGSWWEITFAALPLINGLP